MKAIRFWLEIAKRFLGIWDETTQEMGYTPFKANQKAKEVKTNGDSK
jgi:hypothetical protein